MTLNPEIIEHAIELRANGQSWKQTAVRCGVSEYALQCELTPGYRHKRRKDGQDYKKLRRFRGDRYSLKTGHTVQSTLHVPEQVARDRDMRASLTPRDITAAVFGDPLPGRSALDRRANAQSSS